jgi:hypothetical protein
MIILKNTRLAVIRHGWETQEICKDNLVVKPECERAFERHRLAWENNIMGLKINKI